jgi:hypothetical protein
VLAEATMAHVPAGKPRKGKKISVEEGEACVGVFLLFRKTQFVAMVNAILRSGIASPLISIRANHAQILCDQLGH